MEKDGQSLLSLQDLRVYYGLSSGLFPTRRTLKAVDGVTLEIKRGETLGLVGESGCGKSTLGRATLRLTEPTAGRIVHEGQDLTRLSPTAMRKRRQRLQMIFQDTSASLNPRMTVGDIIGDPIRSFGLAKGKAVGEQIENLLETVGLSARHLNRYPREFSGGQRQRVGIARALAAEPEFIIADEPISALDVSIQAQIINLLQRLQAEKKLTYLFISHDLRALRHIADRIAVMYLGRIVELAPACELYTDPLMPYTLGLISAVPVPDPEVELMRERIILKGDAASPVDPPVGCPFHTRCPWAIAECKTRVPELVEIKPRHFAACIRIGPEEPSIKANTIRH